MVKNVKVGGPNVKHSYCDGYRVFFWGGGQKFMALNISNASLESPDHTVTEEVMGFIYSPYFKFPELFQEYSVVPYLTWSPFYKPYKISQLGSILRSL